MARPLSSRTLLTLLLAAPLLGCVAKPPEKYIVLRPHRFERRPARHFAPKHEPASTANDDRGATAAASATAEDPSAPPQTAPAPASPLDPAQKEALFRDFDRFLTRSGEAR